MYISHILTCIYINDQLQIAAPPHRSSAFGFAPAACTVCSIHEWPILVYHQHKWPILGPFPVQIWGIPVPPRTWCGGEGAI